MTHKKQREHFENNDYLVLYNPHTNAIRIVAFEETGDEYAGYYDEVLETITVIEHLDRTWSYYPSGPYNKIIKEGWAFIGLM